MGRLSSGCAPTIAQTGALLPSLTPVWRSAEFQEREIYDLYGILFDGHPDLRRILMWDEFTDFPMRKDYREPDDYEYEPTPHDDVLEKAKQHYAPRRRWTARKISRRKHDVIPSGAQHSRGIP